MPLRSLHHCFRIQSSIPLRYIKLDGRTGTRKVLSLLSTFLKHEVWRAFSVFITHSISFEVRGFEVRDFESFLERHFPTMVTREQSPPGSSATGASARLLLHCVDGCFPFLTPYMLTKCFPPENELVSETLVLGLAVRDTCVVPYYNGKKKKRKESVSSNRKNPRGYTFSSDIKPDPWLMPYSRFTVPTFDLLDDARNAPSNMHNSAVQVSATDHEVHMWTANGRVPLKPDIYNRAAATFQSGDYVPLFDAIPPVTLDLAATTRETTKAAKAEKEAILVEKRRVKRARIALDRTRAFTESSATATNEKCWIPLLLDSGNSSMHQNQLNDRQSHVALVGWSHLGSAERDAQLRRIVKCQYVEKIAVLSVTSLDQILCLLQVATPAAEIVIGSDLPTAWARNKKAFLVDWRSPCLGTRLDSDGCLGLADGSWKPKDHPWFRDEGPLFQGCKCWSCRTHSRSYVYHLVCAQEILAEVLLFIHNLHHLLELIRQGNSAVKSVRSQIS